MRNASFDAVLHDIRHKFVYLLLMFKYTVAMMWWHIFIAFQRNVVMYYLHKANKI
jgi:hypothetical protein